MSTIINDAGAADTQADQILAAFLLVYYVFSLSQQLSLSSPTSLFLSFSLLSFSFSLLSLSLSLSFLSLSLSFSLSPYYLFLLSHSLSVSCLSSSPLLLSFFSLSGEGKERGREKERV